MVWWPVRVVVSSTDSMVTVTHRPDGPGPHAVGAMSILHARSLESYLDTSLELGGRHRQTAVVTGAAGGGHHQVDLQTVSSSQFSRTPMPSRVGHWVASWPTAGGISASRRNDQLARCPQQLKASIGKASVGRQTQLFRRTNTPVGTPAHHAWGVATRTVLDVHL